MNEEYEKAIENSPELKQYAERIPRDLWKVLLPKEVSDLEAFSASIKSLRIKEKEREYIIELRKKYGLSFRPNADIDETIKRVRLIRWKRKKWAEGILPDEEIEDSSADSIDPGEELI